MRAAAGATREAIDGPVELVGAERDVVRAGGGLARRLECADRGVGDVHNERPQRPAGNGCTRTWTYLVPPHSGHAKSFQ